MIPIVIPTYRRMDQQFTYFTFDDLWSAITIVARPDEAPFLRKKYPMSLVMELPDEVRTLPATRQWIWERFRDTRFLMADDDIQWFRRREFSMESGPRTAEKNMTGRELIRELSSQLDYEGVAMASPAPNWIPPSEQTFPWIHAGPCLGVTMIDGPKIDPNTRWDRVNSLEDQDFVLQVLAQGLDTVVRTDLVMYTQPKGSNRGGLNDDPDVRADGREAVDERARKILMDLWPGYVSRTPTGRFRFSRKRLLADSGKSMSLEHEDDEIEPVTEAPKRKRGRPPLGTEDRHSQKLIISLTKDEMRQLIVKAANATGGPFKPTEWARKVLLGQ